MPPCASRSALPGKQLKSPQPVDETKTRPLHARSSLNRTNYSESTSSATRNHTQISKSRPSDPVTVILVPSLSLQQLDKLRALWQAWSTMITRLITRLSSDRLCDIAGTLNLAWLSGYHGHQPGKKKFTEQKSACFNTCEGVTVPVTGSRF